MLVNTPISRRPSVRVPVIVQVTRVPSLSPASGDGSLARVAWLGKIVGRF